MTEPEVWDPNDMWTFWGSCGHCGTQTWVQEKIEDQGGDPQEAHTSILCAICWLKRKRRN